MSRLSFPEQVRAISLLADGMSLRATSRTTGFHRTTLMNLAQRVGTACQRLHDARVRDLQVGCLELDEMWGYIGCRQENVRPDSPADHGDYYLWLGVDANTKVIVSFHVGKRGQEDADVFVRDVRARVLNRPQIVTDAHRPYASAVEAAFGTDVDYIQLNKYRGEYQKLQGNPDLSRATTNHCERLNLTVRAFLRRYTRRTLAFSRKLDAHRAATALFVARYNWTHLHRSLRVTPAMEAGLTPSVWSMEDVVREAMQTPHDVQPPEPPPEPRYPWPGRRPFRPYVSRGSWSRMR